MGASLAESVQPLDLVEDADAGTPPADTTPRPVLLRRRT